MTAVASSDASTGAEKAKTTPTRIPEETSRSVRQMAALKGITPGDLIREAWNEYLANHREEFANNLALAAELMRAGDTLAVSDVLFGETPELQQRAADAAAAARQTL